jgi:hypothetical protein
MIAAQNLNRRPPAFGAVTTGAGAPVHRTITDADRWSRAVPFAGPGCATGALVTPILPFVSLVALLATVAPLGADCTTRGCGAEQAAAVAALRAGIAASCDCAGSARRRNYRRCAKALVREAQHEGRISKACGRAPSSSTPGAFTG